MLRWSLVVMVGFLLVACDNGNQRPFATVDTVPTTKVMTEKSWQEYYVAQYFRDPEQDPLSFSASIEEATVANAVVEDKNDDSITLVIEGVAAGETIVTLTATDPYGGEARVSGQVLVVEPVLFWRDDFDFNNGEWALSGTYSYYRRPGAFGGISGEFGASRMDYDYAVDWLVSLSVATDVGSANQTVGSWSYVETDSASNSSKRWLWATVGDTEEYRYIAGAVTPSNWQLVWCCGYTWGAGGMSDAVSDVGEFSELHWGARLGEMTVFIGETLVWSEDAVEGDWPSIHVLTSLFSYSGGGEADQWAYFDWAELWGMPIEEGEAGSAGERELEEGPKALGKMPPAVAIPHDTGIIVQ